ncbi:hypothetical protein AD998_15455 [bacterium 336/3]|nr:hypothetical protein AD998_15455 [bacterium 336/3]
MQGSKDIKAVALISSDGLMLHSNISDINPDKVAALSAAVLGLAKKSASEMNFGGLNEVQIRGEDATYIILSIGVKKLLTLIVSSQANIGMINILTRETVKSLSEDI